MAEDQGRGTVYIIIVAREEKMYKSIKNYLSFDLSIKLLYDFLAILLYATELGFYIYGSNDNIQKFHNRPSYEVIEMYHGGILKKTVSAKGKLKYCGHYGDPQSVVDFTENIGDFYYYCCYVYLVFYVTQALIDGYKRFKARCKKRFNKDSGTGETETPSNFMIFIRVLGC